MRILGIDYGEKRVGVALSDPLGFTAQGLQTIEPRGKKHLLQELKAVCEKNEVTEVVIGLPVNMDGSRGPKAKQVLDLAPEMERALGVPVRTWDERLSTSEVSRLMSESGTSAGRRKAAVDRLAATVILQNYLEARRARGERNA